MIIVRLSNITTSIGSSSSGDGGSSIVMLTMSFLVLRLSNTKLAAIKRATLTAKLTGKLFHIYSLGLEERN